MRIREAHDAFRYLASRRSRRRCVSSSSCRAYSEEMSRSAWIRRRGLSATHGANIRAIYPCESTRPFALKEAAHVFRNYTSCSHQLELRAPHTQEVGRRACQRVLVDTARSTTIAWRSCHHHPPHPPQPLSFDVETRNCGVKTGRARHVHARRVGG